jgi:Fe-S-cluster containining protein
MADSKDSKEKAVRISFPESEEAHPWLTMLLDAYQIFDEGIAKAIKRDEKKGRVLACKKGCSACCYTQTTIPVYPLELVGMAWYATEKVKNKTRKKLVEHLKNYKSCPFLIDDVCSIYPLRPAACRHFNVFDRVCERGEDAYYTRREDVLTPIDEYKDRAFNVMLPFYGATNRAKRRQVLKSGAIHTKATPILDCNWSTLPDKMKEYERENPDEFKK